MLRCTATGEHRLNRACSWSMDAACLCGFPRLIVPREAMQRTKHVARDARQRGERHWYLKAPGCSFIHPSHRQKCADSHLGSLANGGAQQEPVLWLLLLLYKPSSFLHFFLPWGMAKEEEPPPFFFCFNSRLWVIWDKSAPSTLQTREPSKHLLLGVLTF